MEPLRAEWDDVYAAAVQLDADGKTREAIALVREFHGRLCEVRILDPACGSGNFLYVALELIKRLEGEVLNALKELGDKAPPLLTVDPHQFLGIEVNPRAAAIADLVLWIGYLQWHFRTRGRTTPPEPVLHAFHNIECRDAVLAHDGTEPVLDASGNPVTRWDGRTTRPHPVTGEEVPDETARAAVLRYKNPRKADWPEADFVVGNPPFLGSKLMRDALGDGYIDAIQKAWPEVPQATDFVLRWWHHAANLLKEGRIRRFGFITTNSIRQTYNRRAIEPHLNGDGPVSIAYAIPDHPWVDSADGAAVRISITVCSRGDGDGSLVRVTKEQDGDGQHADDLVAETASRRGRIYADLSAGVDLSQAVELRANAGLCAVGFKTIGAAFVVDHDEATALGLGRTPGLERHIRPYLNGRDLAAQSRDVFVIDFFALEESDVRQHYPEAYQHLLTRAKPERDHNRNRIFRKFWWVIGHPRPVFRNFTANLSRYIATIETSTERCAITVKVGCL